MSTDPRDIGVPGSEIIDGFSKEVKRAFKEAVEKTTKDVVGSILLKSTLFAVAGMIGGMIMGIGGAYLYNSFAQPDSWSINRDGVVEMCGFAPESTNVKPMFVCKTAPPVVKLKTKDLSSGVPLVRG